MNPRPSCHRQAANRRPHRELVILEKYFGEINGAVPHGKLSLCLQFHFSDMLCVKLSDEIMQEWRKTCLAIGRFKSLRLLQVLDGRVFRAATEKEWRIIMRDGSIQITVRQILRKFKEFRITERDSDVFQQPPTRIDLHVPPNDPCFSFDTT
uniref:Uncharacterized protein n=1 Tax=Compsopogon caeruleus TaxID=31354 RepID=A0A7S1THY3_9RHOD|mmetsp:Transcript_7175/g.14755  ORF Transcript_7175/g.14755 Transcript_7175/m.14755 type:complete len:152 (+) Transcript_7175:473-928(+)